MLKRIVTWSLILLIHVINISNNTNTLNKYGEFTLEITSIKLCKGPKRLDCCNINAKVENGSHIDYGIEIKNNVIVNRGKVVAMVNGKPLIRLQMKKPCDHLFMKPLFQAMLNVSQRCEFKKGHYFVNIDIEDIAQRYYGGIFFYGKIMFKALFYNDECNFSCTEVEVKFSPKNNSSS